MSRNAIITTLLVISLTGNLVCGYLKWASVQGMQPVDIKRIDRVAARADLYNMIPIDTGAVVLLGDSHFENFPASELLPGRTIANRGLSGQASSSIVERAEKVARSTPHRVLLMAGINDIFQGVGIEEYTQNMQGMLHLFASQRVKMVVVSIPPNAYPTTQRSVDAFNKALSELCNARDVTFVDLDPLLLHNGLLNPELTYDGLHLNGAGNMLLGKALAPHVR